MKEIIIDKMINENNHEFVYEGGVNDAIESGRIELEESQCGCRAISRIALELVISHAFIVIS